MEVHHVAPRCLLGLHERANGTTTIDGQGIQAWLEWEWEAMRWKVPVEISTGIFHRIASHSHSSHASIPWPSSVVMLLALS